MWIEKIELTNFKAYKYQTFNFPKPEQGRNLVLIGGMNGFGKTTMLEALYLCLYGEDATHHLARAGLQSNSYVKFLQGALHGKAASINRDQMRVTVRLIVSDGIGFEISRTWFFDPKGELQDQEIRLEEIRNGISKPLDRDVLASVLEEHVVPANLAPFFFFDGEEVKKLADQDRTGWIKQGMESLMGVVLVKTLRDSLVKYQNNRRANGHNVDKNKLTEMLDSLNSKNEQHALLKNNLLISNEEIARQQTKRDEVQQKLLELGVGNGNVKSIQDILGEEAENKQSLNSCEKELENLLADRLPFHLVSSDLIDSLKIRLEQEKIRLDWDSQKQELEPRKNRFVEAFFNTEFLQKQNDSIKGKLADCVTEAWESLYFPKPANCASNLLHDYLESRQRQKLDYTFSNIQVGASQIRHLVTQRKNIEVRLNELKIRRLKLDGINTDGVLQTLNKELTDIQKELELKNKDLGDLERQEIALESAISRERATYERENDHYIRSEPAKSVANKAQKVIRLVDELLPRLFDLKTVALSEAVTRYYKKLSHKRQVSNIIIQADGNCRLLSEDGKEVKFDRSAGENQLFATALFAGLAEVSGYEIPLVVDTPLARLDSQHRKNLLSYWCSKPDRQVILLSQDEEVDQSLMQSVAPHLSKTYLLESTLIGNGVYETIAKDNCYFGDEYEWN